MKQARWIFCAAIAALCLLCAMLPQLAGKLIWRRDGLEQGQWWLAFSAHFIHINSRHVLFNLLGLFLLCELFWDQLSMPDALIMLLVSAAGVSVLLWLMQPALLWYAGLSGVLHGLWAGFAGAGWIRQRSIFFAAGLAALCCKLLLMPQTVSTMPVVSVAHVYGAGSGLLSLLFISRKRLIRPVQQKPELD